MFHLFPKSPPPVPRRHDLPGHGTPPSSTPAGGPGPFTRTHPPVAPVSRDMRAASTPKRPSAFMQIRLFKRRLVAELRRLSPPRAPRVFGQPVVQPARLHDVLDAVNGRRGAQQATATAMPPRPQVAARSQAPAIGVLSHAPVPLIQEVRSKQALRAAVDSAHEHAAATYAEEQTAVARFRAAQAGRGVVDLRRAFAGYDVSIEQLDRTQKTLADALALMEFGDRHARTKSKP